ncbi:MAG: hypothetical protein ACE5HO_19010 [bacterium]
MERPDFRLVSSLTRNLPNIIGVGFTDDSDKVFGSFSPIGFNVRTVGVPFLKDTWIFPGMSLQKSGSPGFAASVSTTF